MMSTYKFHFDEIFPSPARTLFTFDEKHTLSNVSVWIKEFNNANL